MAGSQGGLPGGAAAARAPLVLTGIQVRLRTAPTRLATSATDAGHCILGGAVVVTHDLGPGCGRPMQP